MRAHDGTTEYVGIGGVVTGTAIATVQNGGCSSAAPTGIAVDASGGLPQTLIVTGNSSACTWTAFATVPWG